MTPEQFAATWEDARLGEVLALLLVAVGVVLYVAWKWKLSREYREEQRRALMGEPLIDRIGDLSESGQVQRTREQWRAK